MAKKSKGLVIGNDMDGVMFHFREGVRRTALDRIEIGDLDAKHEENLKTVHASDYFFWSQNWGLPENFVDDYVYEVFSTGGVKRDARNIMRRFREDGHHLKIITSPWKGLNNTHPKAHQLFRISSQAKLDWLERMGIRYDDIVFTHHKELCMMDVLIDDGMHNHKALVKANHPAVHIGYDIDGLDHDKFFEVIGDRIGYACDSWDEIETAVAKIYKNKEHN